MRRILLFTTIIGLFIALSSVTFGQKTKKTKTNPNSQAGSEAATNNTNQGATKEQAEQMKVRDKNSWFNTKVYVEIALSYLANPANGFADDNNFQSLKQNTQDAHALLICHENGANPCNSSGEAQNLRKGNIEAVKNSLNNAKSDLSRNAFSSAEKTAVIAKLNKAIELANVYINAHTYTEKSQKGKGIGADNLVKTNPSIDESTKTKKGQNPINNGTSNSSTSNSTQKTKKPNSGFMDQPDDAAKVTPKNAKTTNNLGGDDDPEKTQRSTKTNNTKSTKKTNGKSVGPNGIEMTPCDVQGTAGKIGNCNNVTGNNAKTTTKASNSNTSKKPNVNGVYEEDEQKTPKKSKPTTTKTKKP